MSDSERAASRSASGGVSAPTRARAARSEGRSESTETTQTGGARAAQSAGGRRTRKAHLRLTQVDPWSVMKTAFLLSIALGIVSVVAVIIIWSVLSAAGVFDSVDSMVQQVMSNQFHVQDYIGTGRIVGFTLIVAVVDVALITAIATLSAFLYNLAATLVGGIEVTLAEDR